MGATYGSGDNLSPAILGLASTCALFSAGASFWSMWTHFKNYRKVRLQRYVVRILLMVPIYAISSLVSLYSLDLAFFLDALRDVYEALVIYCFFRLLTEYLGGQRELLIHLQGRPPTPHLWPLSMVLPSSEMSDPYVFLTIKRGILQYVLVKPVLAIITFILKVAGTYNDGTLGAYTGYTYVSVAYNISVTISLYCLAFFWLATNEDLKPFRPIPKFMCVKGIIFFSFWQGLSVSILVATGVIHSETFPTETLSIAIQDTLICCEMPLFAVLHLYAFSYTDFVDRKLNFVGRMPLRYAIRDVLGIVDIYQDYLNALSGEGTSYILYEPSEGFMHQGRAQLLRIKAGLRYSDRGARKYWIIPARPKASTPSGSSANLAARVPDSETQPEAESVNTVVQGANGAVWSRKMKRPSFIDDDAASEIESIKDLQFDEEEEDLLENTGMEDLYAKARTYEYGDTNYPVIDASREDAEDRRRAEEQEWLNSLPITRSRTGRPPPSYGAVTQPSV